ncbi:MAG: hypothetical protein LBB08_02730 [Rickettsiales bacterium]|jgi:hypothetical protein|nr:hypothetical protein [Rickettsiales bacterium]
MGSETIVFEGIVDYEGSFVVSASCSVDCIASNGRCTGYVDSGLSTRVKNVVFESFKTRAEGFATAAQGSKADSAYQKPTAGIPKTDLASAVQTSLAKADSAVQPATLNSYVQKTGSWWTDKSIVPDTGGLFGNWTRDFGYGTSSSWVVRNTSTGYEFRGWANCSGSPSNAYTWSNTLEDDTSCWCKMSDPVMGSSWIFYGRYNITSLCAGECAYRCADCIHLGGAYNCSRSALISS